VFDSFTRLVTDASGWTYGIILLFALLDAVLPVVPSEATVITAGVVCSTGHLDLPLVLVVAAVGAWLGDNLVYGIGRRYGERAKARFFSGDKAANRVAWAERQLGERGNELIVIGRFIPAGRTLITLTAGTLAYPWRRFAFFDVIAAVIWALYAGLLGYFGGKAFEDAPWKGLALAFGLALAVTGGIELFRWLRRRRQ
jgi:membrane-associated protein